MSQKKPPTKPAAAAPATKPAAFLTAGLKSAASGAEALLQMERPVPMGPMELVFGLVVDGQRFAAEFVVEDRGATGSPQYHCFLRVGALTLDVQRMPPSAHAPAPSSLGPDYVVGTDGFPILKSKVGSPSRS